LSHCNIIISEQTKTFCLLDNIDIFNEQEFFIMANNKAKAALEQFKMEAANEVGVTLNNDYNGDLTARQAGSIGGQMVKKMIESYENSMTTK
jgi:hypothetical protein